MSQLLSVSSIFQPPLLHPTEAETVNTFFSCRANSSWPSWGSFVSLFSCIPCGRSHICLGTIWLGQDYGTMHPYRRLERRSPTEQPVWPSSLPNLPYAASSITRVSSGYPGLSLGYTFPILLYFSGNGFFSPSTVPSGLVPNLLPTI